MPEARGYTKTGIDDLIAGRAASSHDHVSSSITDFLEAVQDVIGAFVTAVGGTYNDAEGSFTLPVDPQATETTRGSLEIATQAETDAGADNIRAVTPEKLKGALTKYVSSDTSIAKLWTGTQAAYDAIATKDPATLYFIK